MKRGPKPGYGIPVIERLLARTDVRSCGECWEWLGYRDDLGYGRIGLTGRSRGHKTALVHRVMYLYVFGELPEGILVIHSCDNPPCINPYHLLSGTHLDNNQDMMTKGRNVILRGSQIGTSKLDESVIRNIKSLFGVLNDCEIARRFSISSSSVWNIRHGRSWSHVI